MGIVNELLSWWLSGHSKNTNICDEIFDSVADTAINLWALVLQWLGNTISDIFNFDINSFNDRIPIATSFYSLMTGLGAVLVILFLLFYIIKKLIMPKEVKQNPINVFIKAGVVAVILYAGTSINITSLNYQTTVPGTILVLMRNISNIIVNPSISGSASSSLVSCIEANALASGDSIDIFGTVLQLVEQAIPFVWLIEVLVSWPLIKAIFRFVLEWCERYIMFIIYILMFPLILPFVMLEETSDVFTKYLKAIIGQSIIVLLNHFLYYAIVYAYANLNTPGNRSLIGYIFVIGFINLCARFDKMLDKMGLSMPQTYGQLGSHAFGSFVGMARGLNNARKNTGKALQGIGVATNKGGIHHAGKILGADMNSLAREGLPTRKVADMDMSGKLAAQGKANANVDRYSAAQMMQNVITQPNNTTLRRSSAGMMESEAAKKVLSGWSGIDANSISNVRGTKTGIAFDANGKTYGITGNPQNGLGKEIKVGNEPTGMYINSQKTAPNGQVVSAPRLKNGDSDISSLKEDFGVMGADIGLNAGYGISSNDAITFLDKDTKEPMCKIDTTNGNVYSQYDKLGDQEAIKDQLAMAYEISDAELSGMGEIKTFSMNEDHVGTIQFSDGSTFEYTDYINEENFSRNNERGKVVRQDVDDNDNEHNYSLLFRQKESVSAEELYDNVVKIRNNK